MRVVGRNAAYAGYEVEFDVVTRTLTGRVPESLMGTPGAGAPRHTPAYGWLAKNEKRIATAPMARAEGRTPPAPFDRVTLGGD